MRLVIPLLVLASAACASTDHSNLVRPTTEQGPIACYQGTVRVTLPGQAMVVAEYPALLRRTFKHKEQQIVEESIVQRPDAIDRHTTTWDVARECTVSEEDGAYSGTCEMRGAPWQWHAWTAVLQRPVQGTLWTEEREDKVTASGLLARRWTRAQDGTEGPTTIETYEAIPPAEFEAMWLKAVRAE
jgi:hypothetical protein